MKLRSLILVFLLIFLFVFFPFTNYVSASVYFNDVDLGFFIVDQFFLLSSSFKLAEQSDTIKAYEIFLDSSGKYIDELFDKFVDVNEISDLDEDINQFNENINQFNDIYFTHIPSATYIKSLNKMAINNIYSIVKHADLIEGYQYFLRKYPDSIHAQDAINRIYFVAYAVAEQDNKISSYLDFLSNFKAAPEKLRTAALDHASDLQCSAVRSDFDSQLKLLPENQRKNIFYQEFIADRIARSLYNDALEAKDQDNLIDFQLKYNVLFSCDLFANSSARFSLQLNSELKDLLENIERNIVALRNDIETVEQLLVQKLNDIQENQEQQSSYLNSIKLIIEEQSRKPDPGSEPSFCWDGSFSVWENVRSCGTLVMDGVNNVVIPTYELIAILSKYK